MRRLSLLVLVLVLAACGGERDASSPAEVLDQAAENMVAAGSLRYTMDSTMLSRDLSEKSIPIRGEGVATTDDERGRMTMDLSEMIRAVVAQEAGPEEREFLELLFGDAEGWQAETRYIGDQAWMRVPALTELVGGKPWIELADTDEPESGLDLALGNSPDNPAALLPYLRSLGPVTEVGKQQVRGLETTHYSATVELDRVPDQAPADERDELREKIERTIEQTGQRTVPLDIWVDEDALPRRMRFVDVSPPGEDEKYPTTWSATIDILEYGVPVEVVPPPPGKVMPEEELDRLMDDDGSA